MSKQDVNVICIYGDEDLKKISEDSFLMYLKDKLKQGDPLPDIVKPDNSIYV